MIFTCKIIKVLPSREGLSQKTGKPWKMRNYHIMFAEPKKDGTQISHYIKASTFQRLNDEMVLNAKMATSDVVLDVRFDLVSSKTNGECYNNILVYFPKEFISDEPETSATMEQLANTEGTVKPNESEGGDGLPF